MANKAVRMLKAYRSNTAGEVCGFEESEANEIIAMGLAEPLEPPKSPSPSAAEVVASTPSGDEPEPSTEVVNPEPESDPEVTPSRFRTAKPKRR